MERPAAQSAEQVIAASRRIAILDKVNDPSNVGAIFRSAAALGMDSILLTASCCDPLYRRCARVSMGAVFRIPWARIGASHADRPEHFFPLLKQYGFTTAAMALRGDSVPIDDPVLSANEKVAVLLGSEGPGLDQATIDACDYTAMIPMAAGMDSLNVAAAAAVAFWVLRTGEGR